MWCGWDTSVCVPAPGLPLGQGTSVARDTFYTDCEDTPPKELFEDAQQTELTTNLKAEGCCAADHLRLHPSGAAGTTYTYSGAGIPRTLKTPRAARA